MKTPGQILFESQGIWRLEWASLDERVRKQFEMEGAAVWNAGVQAAADQVADHMIAYLRTLADLKAQP